MLSPRHYLGGEVLVGLAPLLCWLHPSLPSGMLGGIKNTHKRNDFIAINKYRQRSIQEREKGMGKCAELKVEINAKMSARTASVALLHDPLTPFFDICRILPKVEEELPHHLPALTKILVWNVLDL